MRVWLYLLRSLWKDSGAENMTIESTEIMFNLHLITLLGATENCGNCLTVDLYFVIFVNIV